MALAPGTLGGPGLPDKVRITDASITSDSIWERDSMGRFISDIERAGSRLLEDLGQKMQRRAKRYAPSRTGRLRNSITYVMLSNDREVVVYSDVPYAGVMEKGSKPHRIHGVRAHFTWKNGTRTFVPANFEYGPVGSGKYYENWSKGAGATVKHPGTKPHYFFKRAFDETWAEARVVMREAYPR